MKFVCFKILYLFSTLLPSKCSALPMSQHATSSQSIVFNPAQITSTAASPKITEENDPQNAKYEYKYEVSDLRTGDRKTHWESRHGDVVRGVYTLYEPDGALRTVEYTADALHGFNAVVRRNAPSPHQYPRTKPSLHSFTKAQDDGKAFKTDEPNDFSHNPAQGSFYNNLGVDFTVNHVLSNDSGRRKYY